MWRHEDPNQSVPCNVAGFASQNVPSVSGGKRFRHFYGMLDTAAPPAMVT